MDLISFLIALTVLGLVCWLLWTYILPLFPEPIRTVITVILVLVLCIWLLQWAGLTTLRPFHLR